MEGPCGGLRVRIYTIISGRTPNRDIDSVYRVKGRTDQGAERRINGRYNEYRVVRKIHSKGVIPVSVVKPHLLIEKFEKRDIQLSDIGDPFKSSGCREETEG